MNNGKPLWQSKTFWANVVALIGMVVTATGAVLPPDWVQYEAILLAIVNVGLRLVTNQPITGIIVLPEDAE